MNQIILTVHGMTWTHCQSSVERALNQLNGVESIGVNLAEKKVTVGYDKNQVSIHDIKNAIEDIGYDVE